MGIVGLLVLLLLVASIVWVVAMAMRGARPLSGTALPEPRRAAADPEAILAERLARGEIDPDEYSMRLRALRGGA